MVNPKCFLQMVLIAMVLGGADGTWWCIWCMMMQMGETNALSTYGVESHTVWQLVHYDADG